MFRGANFSFWFFLDLHKSTHPYDRPDKCIVTDVATEVFLYYSNESNKRKNSTEEDKNDSCHSKPSAVADFLNSFKRQRKSEYEKHATSTDSTPESDQTTPFFHWKKFLITKFLTSPLILPDAPAQPNTNKEIPQDIKIQTFSTEKFKPLHPADSSIEELKLDLDDEITPSRKKLRGEEEKKIKTRNILMSSKHESDNQKKIELKFSNCNTTYEHDKCDDFENKTLDDSKSSDTHQGSHNLSIPKKDAQSGDYTIKVIDPNRNKYHYGSKSKTDYLKTKKMPVSTYDKHPEKVSEGPGALFKTEIPSYKMKSGLSIDDGFLNDACFITDKDSEKITGEKMARGCASYTRKSPSVNSMLHEATRLALTKKTHRKNEGTGQFDGGLPIDVKYLIQLQYQYEKMHYYPCKLIVGENCKNRKRIATLKRKLPFPGNIIIYPTYIPNACLMLAVLLDGSIKAGTDGKTALLIPKFHHGKEQYNLSSNYDKEYIHVFTDYLLVIFDIKFAEIIPDQCGMNGLITWELKLTFPDTEEHRKTLKEKFVAMHFNQRVNVEALKKWNGYMRFGIFQSF